MQKATLIILFACFGHLTLSSQSNAKFDVGLTFSPLLFKAKIWDTPTQLKFSHQAGLSIRCWFHQRVALGTGVLHTQKNYRVGSSDRKVPYLAIPINLSVRLVHREWWFLAMSVDYERWRLLNQDKHNGTNGTPGIFSCIITPG